ncbi:MAG: hypothetical protein F4W95_11835 [Chloroflexi bacterium]|nr:hypothetical protein [Chloroflexota bacterium]MYD49156.1 hypothetical protein [Chloroflexota bacterium]
MKVNVKQRYIAAVFAAALALALMLGLAACGGDEPEPQPTAMAAPNVGIAPSPTTAPAVATTAPEPTAMAPQPTAVAPAPTVAPAEPTATAQPIAPTPEPTPAMSVAERQAALAGYAAEYAGRPGAIFVGDISQLMGPPPHESLMFDFPESAYTQVSAAALFGLPGSPGQSFIYDSDYYQGLLDKANLLAPTELTSSGESFEIQHVCIDRRLPTCVLVQTYWAPNLAARTNGQVQLSVTSLVELGLAGPGTLDQVANGSLDMANIFTGYVAGAYPGLEVQSLWGVASDWESSYLMLTELAPDIDRMMLDITGGSHVLNRNWFAGSDQWFFSKEPMPTAADFQGRKIRTHSASLTDFIRGMGGEPVELGIGEIYTALQIGTVDATVTTALLGVTGSLYEVANYMAGPLIGFGYTNNVINQDVWDKMPADLRQIMTEEGAKMELEALRLAPFQNFIALEANKQAGLKIQPFTDESLRHVDEVVLPEHVLPGWLRRLGYPNSGGEIVSLFNEKVGPYSGFRINADGSIERVAATKGPRAQ